MQSLLLAIFYNIFIYKGRKRFWCTQKCPIVKIWIDIRIHLHVLTIYMYVCIKYLQHLNFHQWKISIFRTRYLRMRSDLVFVCHNGNRASFSMAGVGLYTWRNSPCIRCIVWYMVDVIFYIIYMLCTNIQCESSYMYVRTYIVNKYVYIMRRSK